MKLQVLALPLFAITLANSSFSQDTIVFNFTGAPATYTIPPCVNGDIEVMMAGASGGSAGYYPNSGGLGAELTGTITVSGGDVIDIIVGGEGPCPGAGYNGGGQGFASANGNNQMNSCGGGGSTNLNINGVPTVIAAGGGGSGGGGTSSFYTPDGGDGGCNAGVTPGNSPFAQGGGGGTQVAAGNGGNPWAGVPPGGSPGIGGQGGMGGNWNTASGGGGGGGYFGGGGGGNDGCCTGANAGAGGGGGSSLWPVATVGCTQGVNSGNGYLILIVPGCNETTLCSGDTAYVDFSLLYPPGTTNYQVTSGNYTYQAIPGDPNIGFFPTDTTIYQITAQTTTGSVTLDWPVNAVDPIFPDAGLDDSLCFSLANGYPLNGTLANNGTMYWETYQLNPFGGGIGNVVYTPGSAQLVTTINANLPGEYLIVLHEEDTNGVCPEGTDTVAIYFSEEEHTTTFTDPICFGASDGTIDVITDVSPQSGNLGANQYSVDGGLTYQASPTFTGLPSGNYTITSMDYLGCTYTSNVTLTDPADIFLTLISSDTTICINGTATMVAQGNAAPAGSTYTYYWSESPDNTSSVQVTPSPPGTDFISTVYAQTSDGCYSDTLSLEVTHHLPITLQITPNDSICPGYDAMHQVTPMGGFLNGQPDYTYSWTENGTPMSDITAMININPTVNTTYCVTVDDGCETTPETICSDVIMRRVPNPMFTSDITWGCNPSTVNFTNTTDPVDVDSITWLINGVYYADQDPLSVTFSDVGTYDVWLEVYSEYGCHDAINVQEYITIYDVPDPLFYINPNPTTMFNTAVELNNVTPGANNTYQWLMPGGSPTTSTVENPSVYYPEGVIGEYPVTLIVTNEWGCVDSITSILEVVSDVIVYAPNIFTPDGDEFNETWRVYIDGIDIYNYHLTLFNRWGEIIWESYDQTAEWQGSYGNQGIVDDGVYVWLIECREITTDKKYEFRGHVTVLK